MKNELDIKQFENTWVDLHLHLDGSLSLAMVRQLAVMQEIALSQSDETLLERLQVHEDCRDLNEYLKKFDFPLSLLQTKEAITYSVSQLLKELQVEGLMYAEIRFAPQLHLRKGLSQYEVVAAAVNGLKDAKIPANLILCCMRGSDNHACNLETVDVAEQFLGKGVCAIDLAGAEGLYPTEQFQDIFARASRKQIPFTIHAGEAAGPESIRSALKFGTNRIGHGVRVIEDAQLMQEISNRKIPLELCPTSNLNTNIFPELSAYPLRLLMDAGIMVTINTDNMMVSNTTIEKEYKKLTQTFALNEQEIRILLNNAIQASFASDSIKKQLERKVMLRINGDASVQ